MISNSYGTAGERGRPDLRPLTDHRGHTIVASSGDFGFTAANFPADLASVTAVGGTALPRAHNARGWSRAGLATASDHGAGGSGCSAYVAKPAWQHDPHCPGRTVADMSAVAADVPIYNKAYGGWLTVGGHQRRPRR